MMLGKVISLDPNQEMEGFFESFASNVQDHVEGQVEGENQTSPNQGAHTEELKNAAMTRVDDVKAKIMAKLEMKAGHSGTQHRRSGEFANKAAERAEKKQKEVLSTVKKKFE